VSKCWKQEKFNWKCLGSSSQDFAQSGAPDSVRCARLALANRLLSGLRQRCTAIIHRTVRWCIGLSGGPFTGELVALGNSSATYGYNSPDCPVCTGLSGEPTVGRAICAGHVAEPTASRRHRTIRCASDCPVRQSTEGKISLPRLLSTAPSCLGAIKGTPRRMEEYNKHSYNIPKHQDINSAPLILCDRN
jgi:hypothetical protein